MLYIIHNVIHIRHLDVCWKLHAFLHVSFYTRIICQDKETPGWCLIGIGIKNSIWNDTLACIWISLFLLLHPHMHVLDGIGLLKSNFKKLVSPFLHFTYVLTYIPWRDRFSFFLGRKRYKTRREKKEEKFQMVLNMSSSCQNLSYVCYWVAPCWPEICIHVSIFWMYYTHTHTETPTNKRRHPQPHALHTLCYKSHKFSPPSF